VNHRRLRSAAAFGVIFAVGLTVGGCKGSEQTPQVIYTTLPTDTAETTPEITPETTPSPTAELTETPAATPTPSPTAAPTPTTEPMPTGTGLRGDSCAGSAGNKEFWAAAAGAMSWAVYCPTWLPSHWHLGSESGSASYSRATGQVLAHYTNTPTGSGSIYVKQGAFCTSSCDPNTGSLGSAAFGDHSGTLYSISGGGFAIYISPGASHGYTISGTGLSQSQFVQMAAQLGKV
jgi:hypothetical protein